MSHVLQVDKLHKTYPGSPPFVAVDHISFHLKQGEILGLLGPNGSGKTTTIYMLLGVLTPTSGAISYFGKNFLTHRSDILQTVTFASAYTSLPSHLTLQENLDVIGRLYGLSPAESAKRYLPLLERFGIAAKRKSQTRSLSAGQLTRLMIVKAFFTRPQVVLLDEPTASLDPEIAQEICRFVLEERKAHGLSILFTSHKMSEAMALCDRTIFLQRGKIVADDQPKRLAKSLRNFSLRLTILDGLKRAKALADSQKLPCKIEERSIEIELEEEAIPPLLNALIQQGISYSSISIQEPSLEDYFLHLATQKETL
jgi:ABC-2 type transport system ATP-binding protein